MEIMVTLDGSIYFSRCKVAPQDVPQKIHERLQHGAEDRVYMAVDARARYADVERALNQIRLAGVHNVSFITN